MEEERDDVVQDKSNREERGRAVKGCKMRIKQLMR